MYESKGPALLVSDGFRCSMNFGSVLQSVAMLEGRSVTMGKDDR